MKDSITRLFLEVGKDYQEKGVATTELHKDHDIHAFYRLYENQSVVVHVQGYTGMSSEDEVRVWARLMDYDKMMEIRNEGGISAGNEHEATTKDFSNFESGVMIAYDAKVLEEMLAENVPELRQSNRK